MSIHDFKSIKPGGLIPPGSDIPIIGQPIPKSVVLDALGRALQVGDFIHLEPRQPFRVQAVQRVEQQPGQPPMMSITLSCTAYFISYAEAPNSEFVRIMTAEEVKERQAKGEQGASVDRPDAQQVGPSDVPPQTLKDA